MDKYDNLGFVGEGSYGMVMKCRHRETSQLVAVKKFSESEDDGNVRKIAMREIRMLRSLQNDHLVNLLEVFRKKKRLFLVFEFVDHTVLDDLVRNPKGLGEMRSKKILWQVLKGTEFCHQRNIIHRDIKPENILVSQEDVVKLCDFGFARTLAVPGEVCTDYVATRWYRSPELLVGDTVYGKAVDIWAIGCLLPEMLTGEALFPGESDLDQLHLILKCIGKLIPRYREIFTSNPLYAGMRIPDEQIVESLEEKVEKAATIEYAIEFIKNCLQLDASLRPSCTECLSHEYFIHNGFSEVFPPELKKKITKEKLENASLYTIFQMKRKKSTSASKNQFENSSQIINGSEKGSEDAQRQGFAKLPNVSGRNELKRTKGSNVSIASGTTISIGSIDHIPPLTKPPSSVTSSSRTSQSSRTINQSPLSIRKDFSPALNATESFTSQNFVSQTKSSVSSMKASTFPKETTLTKSTNVYFSTRKSPERAHLSKIPNVKQGSLQFETPSRHEKSSNKQFTVRNSKSNTLS